MLRHAHILYLSCLSFPCLFLVGIPRNQSGQKRMISARKHIKLGKIKVQAGVIQNSNQIPKPPSIYQYQVSLFSGLCLSKGKGQLDRPEVNKRKLADPEWHCKLHLIRALNTIGALLKEHSLKPCRKKNKTTLHLSRLSLLTVKYSHVHASVLSCFSSQ